MYGRLQPLRCPVCSLQLAPTLRQTHLPNIAPTQSTFPTPSMGPLQSGFFVDKGHLVAQDAHAVEDLAGAERRLRRWLARYASTIGAGAEAYGLTPEDVPQLVNLSSGAQIQVLLFGGFRAEAAVERKPRKAEAAAGATPKMERPRVDTVRRRTSIC